MWVLDIDPSRLMGAKKFLEEDSDLIKKEKMVSKIKKVMALTSSSEQCEAETALRKSEELMLKYNIESLDNHEADEYLFRPVGPILNRTPNYLRDLSNIVNDFYFVNSILCYCGPKGKYYELFGTKENLDIAEYIFCCLLRQAEKLWKDHSAKIRAEYGGIRGYASKNCFIEGLFAGYRNKLENQKESRRESEERGISEALIWTGDPLMTEMYHKSYPKLQVYNYGRNAHGGGYGEGFAKGKGLGLNAGLTSAGSTGIRGRLLKA